VEATSIPTFPILMVQMISPSLYMGKTTTVKFRADNELGLTMPIATLHHSPWPSSLPYFLRSPSWGTRTKSGDIDLGISPPSPWHSSSK
jgi:hypothetical protein